MFIYTIFDTVVAAISETDTEKIVKAHDMMQELNGKFSNKYAVKCEQINQDDLTDFENTYNHHCKGNYAIR